MNEIVNNDLIHLAKNNKVKYQNNDPFPSIYFDDFFNNNFLNEVLKEFPDLSKQNDIIKFNNKNEVKFAGKGELSFGPKTRILMHYLNSEPFLKFLQELTGIKETILCDPYFEGGGLHEIKTGGVLKIHADFNKHSQTMLDRRINVLVYLNKDWKEDYGGHFELWDEKMKSCKSKISPIFNRMTIFSTTDFSYHGHPNPLKCPEHMSRKSLALYYFSNGRPENEITGISHGTIFRGRKGHENDVDQNITLRYRVAKLLPKPILKFIKKIINPNL